MIRSRACKSSFSARRRRSSRRKDLDLWGGVGEHERDDVGVQEGEADEGEPVGVESSSRAEVDVVVYDAEGDRMTRGLSFVSLHAEVWVGV